MAQLSTNDLNDVWREVGSDYSAFRALIPISMPQLHSLLDLIDQEMETAEADIIQALPAGDGKTWLLNNQGLGRDLIRRIEQKRQEVL